MKAAALLLVAAILGCASAQTTYPDVAAALKGSDLTSFAKLLAETGVTVPDGSTVFAPSETAMDYFKSSPTPTMKALRADKAKMKLVAQYHIAPGAALTTDRLKSLANDASDGTFQVGTLAKQVVNVTNVKDALKVNSVPVVDPTNVAAGKSIIQTVDTVLLPDVVFAPVTSAKAAATDDQGFALPPPSSPAPGAPSSARQAAAAASLLLAAPLVVAALL